jgi:putative ABC transport system ATP-binding protein
VLIYERSIPEMSAAAVTLSDVARDFFDGKQLRRVLQPTTLEFNTREFAVIAGPSGSGKTTLLTIIGLILKPSSGRIVIAGKDVTRYGESALATMRMKNFGFVFQQADLIPGLDVMENILIAVAVQGGRVPGAVKIRARDILEQFGLLDYAGAAPQQLSMGQKQRVALVRALINDPVLLLCDEPTSALDVESSRIVLDALKRLASDERRGVVMVTHDPRVFPYADRLIKLENGAVVYDSRNEARRGGDEKNIQDH